MDPRREFTAELLRRGSRALAAGVAERHESIDPEAVRSYGGGGNGELAGDTEVRLLHLAEAVAVDRPALFLDMVSLLKVAHEARGIPVEILDVNLDCMAREISARLPADSSGGAIECLALARRHVASAPSRLPTLLAAEAPLVDVARRYLLAALEARADDAVALLVAELERGTSAADIHHHVIAKVQQELGRMWLMDEIHVAEEHLVSQVTSRAMGVLSERVPPRPPAGRRALCTSVPGDLHELGVRGVADHLRWAGIDALLLGSSTPAPDLVLAVVDFGPDVVVLSASTALHLRSAARLIGTLRSRLAQAPPILVGGRPFSLAHDLWQVIGADATAATASDAPDQVLAVTGARR